MPPSVNGARSRTFWTVAGVQVFSTLVLVVWSAPDRHRAQTLSDRRYWEMITTYSEPEATFVPSGGYESDNLISNERSFQVVVPQLHPREHVAYVGVGPEQNFTYIAALHPDIAFIVDIRRDNLLLHLLYKALAEMSLDRTDFLSRLFARPIQPVPSRRATAARLFARLMRTEPSTPLQVATSTAVRDVLVRKHRFLLTEADLRRIDAIHRAFVRAGPEIRWADKERAWMPTFAELMCEAASGGDSHSFLASDETFQQFAAFERENRIVPLVGDFGGTRTLAAIGKYLQTHSLVLAAFYASNVEPYLKNRYPQFAANLAALPFDGKSLFIRTTFSAIEPRSDRPDYTTVTTAVPISESSVLDYSASPRDSN